MTGPYQTPSALAREPMMAFFWALVAPILFLGLAAQLVSALTPAFDPGSADELRVYQTLWFASCIAMATWFASMSVWSNWLGAGPFAGKMTTTQGWVLLGASLGPLLLMLPSMALDTVMTEDGWQYNGAVNVAIFQPQNWTLAYVFMAVIIAPLVEEVAFRGVAFGALVARGMSATGAIVLSSFAFAFSHLHYSPAGMLVVFLTGAGFAVLRVMSGTVVVPIIAHMAANGVALTLFWMASNPVT